MKLDAYLTKKGITEADFGRLVNLSQPHVNRLRRGESVPSYAALRRIMAATKNKVTAADFKALDEAAA